MITETDVHNQREIFRCSIDGCEDGGGATSQLLDSGPGNRFQTLTSRTIGE